MVIDLFWLYKSGGPAHGERVVPTTARSGDLAAGAWVVLGVSTAVNAIAWGMRGTFALFYVAILAELGWGRGATGASP